MKKILVVGSGIAGLSCSISSALRGNHATLVSPYPSERAQSVMAAGGINAVAAGGEDSISVHVQDTLRGGCDIEDRQAVEGLCGAAPEIIDWLEQIGVQFSRDEQGKIARRAFGGQTYRRTAYAKSSTGKQIVSGLVQKAREMEAKGCIKRRLGLRFYSALIANGRCYGAVFYDELHQRIETIYADAVVMAVGGMNQVFGKTTGSLLCDGYCAGKLLEQGVELRNLEFVQYHPTTIETAQKRMLITEAARGEGGRLYYLKNGERVYFMEDMYGERGNLMPRDIVSKCIYDVHEQLHEQVYLDIAFLGEKLIRDRLAEVYDLCKEYIGLDVTKESIPVYPSVHFFMGGIRVDDCHQTNIKNLYAVGECASKYHGANRLGGNSLLSAMYSGRVAGDAIADSSEQTVPAADFSEEIAEITSAFEKRAKSRSLFPADYLQKELAVIMNEDLGIVRNEAKLREGLNSISFFLSAVEKIQFDPDVSLYQGYRIYHMLLLAKAILLCALERKESRGSHIRTDYPSREDSFACETVVRYDMDNDEIRVSIGKGEKR